MTQTGYVLPDWQPEQVAIEYDADGVAQGRPFDHPWADDGPYWNLRGNGGLLSTASDMFRWHLALEGDEVLDERAKQELFEPRVLEEPGGDSRTTPTAGSCSTPTYGRVLWHNGGNGWSYAEFARLPDEGVDGLLGHEPVPKRGRRGTSSARVRGSPSASSNACSTDRQ